jgi:transcriptional regulator with PAS, ATPase and Fis domain
MPDTRAELIGRSRAIAELRKEIESAASTDAKVLITGESGTGKEVVAHLIHAASGRRARPFVPINCAGIPETLLESELFGHERGSFTGAVRDKAGLFEIANNGTVLLDELGEMSLRMQGVLLRFLETGEVHRVGSDRVRARVNVRIVAATNRDLPDQIRSGNFRLDLFYRLNVIHLRTPALRERPEDVPLLLAHFLSVYSCRQHQAPPQLSAEALNALTAYRWPGNVRELKNVVERIAVRHHDVIQIGDLPVEVTGQVGLVASDSVSALPPPTAETLYDRMITGESFWSAVYEPFMSRDLTRKDVRDVVRRGLGATRGSYKLLVRLFNMPPGDYKRLLNFLRKNDCHVAFQAFRTISTDERQSRSVPGAAA